MENYYEWLGLAPDTSIDELKKQIYQQMRIWSHRTNAPQMERRQEAERAIDKGPKIFASQARS